MKKEQSIKDGQVVYFTFRDIDPEEYGIPSITGALEGKPCYVIDLATYTELGDKDYEYYDILFSPHHIEHAVSGYHLGLEAPKEYALNLTGEELDFLDEAYTMMVDEEILEDTGYPKGMVEDLGLKLIQIREGGETNERSI